jgi:hypothetical protein
MPEQITKYPDVTLKVLRGVGAVCGQGAPQKILKQCPADKFCSLPSGEMCIFGIGDIPKMTQITPQELADVVVPRSKKCVSLLDGERHGQTPIPVASCPTIEASGMPSLDVRAPEAFVTDGLALAGVFLVGLGIGKFWRRFQ